MIRFCRPPVPNMKHIANILKDTFISGQWSNFGTVHEQFRQKLKEVLLLDDNKEIILTSSGHTALMTAYAVLNIKKPIMPSFTFASTFQAATLQGIKPIIVDVDPQTSCLEVLQLKNEEQLFDSVVTVCALSIIPHLNELEKYCKKKRKKLIIDGAAAFGTPNIYNYGDAFCLSFHATKTLPIGEGGALIIDKKYYDKALAYINFGFNKNRKVTSTGINAKLSDFPSAIGVSLLENIDKLLNKRLLNVKRYRKQISKYMLDSWKTDTVYQCLPIFLHDEKQSNKIMKKLLEQNIEVRKYYPPIKKLKVSMNLYRRNLCLPSHQEMSSCQIKYICNLINSS